MHCSAQIGDGEGGSGSERNLDPKLANAQVVHILRSLSRSAHDATPMLLSSPNGTNADGTALAHRRILLNSAVCDLLEHLQVLESRFLSDPKPPSPFAYLRAQCMKALGQSAAACEILRSIVQVRPNYRSANH